MNPSNFHHQQVQCRFACKPHRVAELHDHAVAPREEAVVTLEGLVRDEEPAVQAEGRHVYEITSVASSAAERIVSRSRSMTRSLRWRYRRWRSEIT
jgi:molybdopterin synthase catalytic subunit